MISIILKIIIIAFFLLIFLQDYKDRLVYWFLYPLVGILAFTIQTKETSFIPALFNCLFNISFIVIILLVGYIYSKIVMKTDFVNGAIGFGDILLFLFLCCTFSTVSFLILFVFALIFSLIVHMYLKNKTTDTSVPLAGYISLFFAITYAVSFFIGPKYLYAV